MPRASTRREASSTATTRASPASSAGTTPLRFWEPGLGMAPKPPFVPVHVAKPLLISHARRARARALNYRVNDDKVSVIKPNMGLLTQPDEGAGQGHRRRLRGRHHRGRRCRPWSASIVQRVETGGGCRHSVRRDASKQGGMHCVRPGRPNRNAGGPGLSRMHCRQEQAPGQHCANLGGALTLAQRGARLAATRHPSTWISRGGGATALPSP
jgi:hypothetical protein